MQPESGRIVYAGSHFPHPFQLRFSKEGMGPIWMAWSGFGKTRLVWKQAGVQESSGPVSGRTHPARYQFPTFRLGSVFPQTSRIILCKTSPDPVWFWLTASGFGQTDPVSKQAGVQESSDRMPIGPGMFTGNLFGRQSGMFTGNLFGQQSGMFTGNLFGRQSGMFTGNLFGRHSGMFTGNLFGRHSGMFTGNLFGRQSGMFTGNLFGRQSGMFTGNLFRTTIRHVYWESFRTAIRHVYWQSFRTTFRLVMMHQHTKVGYKKVQLDTHTLEF